MEVESEKQERPEQKDAKVLATGERHSVCEDAPGVIIDNDDDVIVLCENSEPTISVKKRGRPRKLDTTRLPTAAAQGHYSTIVFCVFRKKPEQLAWSLKRNKVTLRRSALKRLCERCSSTWGEPVS